MSSREGLREGMTGVPLRFSLTAYDKVSGLLVLP